MKTYFAKRKFKICSSTLKIEKCLSLAAFLRFLQTSRITVNNCPFQFNNSFRLGSSARNKVDRQREGTRSFIIKIENTNMTLEHKKH